MVPIVRTSVANNNLGRDDDDGLDDSTPDTLDTLSIIIILGQDKRV